MLRFRRLQLTESSATVLLETVEGAAVPQGHVRGPFCEYARTLPAEFPLEELAASGARPAAAAAMIMDPCYWTPALPFEYELHLRGEDPPRRFALRRWYAVGPSLQLSGKRVVLRGAATAEARLELLEEARASEAVLLVPSPDAQFLAAADRRGAAVLADLREVADVASAVESFAQRGCVLGVVMSPEQSDAALAQAPAAGIVSFTTVVAGGPNPQLEIAMAGYIVELGTHERPPEWLAACGRPVIAVRRDWAAIRDCAAARAAADSLQAELAPEFNLAGYFVQTHM